MRREAAVTLFRVGAVQFSEQRSYDHREVRLHLVYAQVHCHSSEKLKDAGSLEIQIIVHQKYVSYTWCHTIHLENKVYLGADTAAVLDSKVPRDLGGSLTPLNYFLK